MHLKRIKVTEITLRRCGHLLILLFLLLMPSLCSAQTVVHESTVSESFSISTTATSAGNAQVLLVQPYTTAGITATNNLGQKMTLDACTSNGSGDGSGDAYNCVFYICNGSSGVTSVTIGSSVGSLQYNIQSVFFEISGVKSSSCAGAVSTTYGPSAPSTIAVAPSLSPGIGIAGFACAGPGTTVTPSTVFIDATDVNGNPVAVTNYTGGSTLVAETDSGGSGCISTDCCRTDGYSAIFATFGAANSSGVGNKGNPVPLVNQPLVPSSAVAGGPALTLIVNGTGFIAGATVDWNGSARPTTFVSASQLTAAISASDVATAATAAITALNPTPGGKASNVVYFPVTTSTSAVTFNRNDFSLATGAIPASVAVGDFNNDGNPDVAVINSSLNTVSVLLGNGNGIFQAKKDVTLSNAPVSVIAADFNRDGNLDLAITSSTSVLILIGNGDGTFQAPATYTVGSSPDFMAAADFNADGALDLAVVNSSGSTVSVLLGNGDGTFQSAVNYPAGASALSVAVGDFNGDGALDLAITNNTSPGTVSILIGNGDGTFKAPVNYASGNSPVSIVSGDFSGDGYLDLAVSSQGGGAVSILLGIGDGTFRTHVDYPAGTSPAAVISADFNGDGKLDLAVANQADNTAAILFGNGNGTFQAAATYSTVSSPLSIAAADFNNDGRIDLAVIGSTNAVSFLIQSSNVSLSPTGLTFVSQNVGTQSAAQTVTLTDTGSAPLGITNIALSGTSPGDFSQTNNCNATVNPGASCSIAVTFTPTNTGTRLASVTIADNASSGSQSISVLGMGIPSAFTSGTSVTFVAGTAGTFTVMTTGTPRYSLSETGSLPSGVTFKDNLDGTGTLSGTPGLNTGGNFNIQFTAINGVNPNMTQNFTLTVNTAAAITSANTASFSTGTAGTFTVTATGTPAPTLSEGGALPAGVTFTAATGKLAGTPAAGTAGNYSITFTAHNGVGTDATQSFTLTVIQAVASTVAFVRSAGSSTRSGAFTVTIAPTAGDFLAVVVMQIEGGATPTVMTDNKASVYTKDCDLTYNQGFGAGRRMTVYHLLNAPSGITTVNITTTVPTRAIVAEYSGMPTSGTVLDVCGTVNNQTSGVTSWTSPATTTTANDVVLGIAETGYTGTAGYAAGSGLDGPAEANQRIRWRRLVFGG